MFAQTNLKEPQYMSMNFLFRIVVDESGFSNHAGIMLHSKHTLNSQITRINFNPLLGSNMPMGRQGVQVCSEGSVPGIDSESNSRYVSCSHPSLQRHKAPGVQRYINGFSASDTELSYSSRYAGH